MSQENEELARQCYEAVNRHDFDALLRMCDPAVEFEPPERAPYAGTYRGIDAVRELVQSLSEVWDFDGSRNGSSRRVIGWSCLSTWLFEGGRATHLQRHT